MASLFNKKILLIFLVIMITNLCACAGNGSNTAGANTIGTKYTSEFDNSKLTDPNEIVDNLIANIEVPYELVKMDVEPGYLNGFDSEITGFSEGVTFSPMIGSIPFVGYVFRSDDPEKLLDSLRSNANMRWNICTEADEMVSSIKGDLVFFMMCTNEEQ